MNNPIYSIMKGIAIIGVVIGHAGVSQWTEAFVNQWDLATFFFVSGACFKEKYLTSPLQYVQRRLKSLYIPFIQFGILYLLLHNLLYYINCVENKYTIKEILMEVFNLTLRLTSSEPLMGAMWFCPALLFSSLVMYSTKTINNKLLTIYGAKVKWGEIILPIIIFIIGYTAIQFKIKSPYCIWQYMVISIIIFMGYWFQKHIQFTNFKSYTHILILILGFTFISFCTNINFMARLQPYNINNENFVGLIMIPLISGLTIYSLSYLLNKTILKPTLSYIGDHSFSIMAMHFLAFKLVNFFQISFYDYNIHCLKEFPVIQHENSWGWSILYVIAGISLPLLCGHLYNKIIKK